MLYLETLSPLSLLPFTVKLPEIVCTPASIFRTLTITWLIHSSTLLKLFSGVTNNRRFTKNQSPNFWSLQVFHVEPLPPPTPRCPVTVHFQSSPLSLPPWHFSYHSLNESISQRSVLSFLLSLSVLFSHGNLCTFSGLNYQNHFWEDAVVSYQIDLSVNKSPIHPEMFIVLLSWNPWTIWSFLHILKPKTRTWLQHSPNFLLILPKHYSKFV